MHLAHQPKSEERKLGDSYPKPPPNQAPAHVGQSLNPKSLNF